MKEIIALCLRIGEHFEKWFDIECVLEFWTA